MGSQKIEIVSCGTGKGGGKFMEMKQPSGILRGNKKTPLLSIVFH